MRSSSVLVALILTACAPAAVPDPGGDCVAPRAGRWTGNGSCFGMEMTSTADVTGCAVTFRDWNMLMSVPDGATLAGNTVTFVGDDWSDCTGTINDDGTAIAGGCSDGCDLDFVSGG
jgi:hypothetical protein